MVMLLTEEKMCKDSGFEGKVLYPLNWQMLLFEFISWRRTEIKLKKKHSISHSILFPNIIVATVTIDSSPLPLMGSDVTKYRLFNSKYNIAW